MLNGHFDGVPAEDSDQDDENDSGSAEELGESSLSELCSSNASVDDQQANLKLSH